MINLPRKKDSDLLKRDEDLQKKREAFISKAPLKEGIKEAPQPAPIMDAAISPQEETPAFQNFKISKEKPKEKKVKQRRKKKAPETLKNIQLTTYVPKAQYEKLKEICEAEEFTEAALLRKIIRDYLEQRLFD